MYSLNPIEANVVLDWDTETCDNGLGRGTWVRQRRTPSQDACCWSVAGEDGFSYVLSRRTGSVPYYVLQRFSPNGRKIRAASINKKSGFGHRIDGNPLVPQICMGPQGLVIVASPSYNIYGLEPGQTSHLHYILCLDPATFSVRWSLATSMGIDYFSPVYVTDTTFNVSLGIYANKLTGHTYFFQSYGGKGNDLGDIGMTTITPSGKVHREWLFSLPAGNYFTGGGNVLHSIVQRADGAFIAFGAHLDHPGNTWPPCSWSVMFSANGMNILRPMLSYRPTLSKASGCFRSDGNLIMLSGEKAVVFSLDGSTAIEAWSCVGHGVASSQLKRGSDGLLYWFLDGGSVDSGVTEWTVADPGSPLNAPEGSSVTGWIRKLSADGKMILASRQSSIGSLNSPWGAVGTSGSYDVLQPDRDQFFYLAGGWALTSFDMSSLRKQFPLLPSYPAFVAGQSDTYAKFVSVKAPGALPVNLATTTAAVPIIETSPYSPGIFSGTMATWRPLIRGEADVAWALFSQN